MLALMVAFELGVARRDRFASDLVENWKFKGQAACREAVRSDILCFGDSMVEFGIAPRVMEDQLGRSAYNLGMHAGPPAAGYYLLGRVLAAGGRPRAIVVDLMPQQIAIDPLDGSFRRGWAELLGVGECLDLAWRARDGSFFLSALVSKVLASYRSRHEMRTSLLAALAGQDYSAKQVVRLLRRNWEVNRGAQVLPLGHRDPLEVSMDPSKAFPVTGVVDAVTLTYARRFFRLAASRSIPVYWLLPPLRPDVQEARRRAGQDDWYTEFVRAIQSENAGLSVIDGRRSGYGRELFVDAVHLNRRGACALSAGLAAAVGMSRNRGAAVQRWVDLPAFRDQPIGSPVEDLAASRIALKSNARRQ